MLSHFLVSNSLRPHGPWPTRLLCPQDSPDRNTGVGCCALLQGIFLTQWSNPRLSSLLHWQEGFLPLAPPGKPLHSYTFTQKEWNYGSTQNLHKSHDSTIRNSPKVETVQVSINRWINKMCVSLKTSPTTSLTSLPRTPVTLDASWCFAQARLRPPMWCVGDPQGTQLRVCSACEEGQAATPLGGPQALTRHPGPVLPYAQSIPATDSSLDCSLLSLKFLPGYHLLREASQNHPRRTRPPGHSLYPLYSLIFLPGSYYYLTLFPGDMTWCYMH